MVFIHVKTSALTPDSSDEFLVETKTSTKVDDLIASIVEIHNIRLRAALISSHLSTAIGNAVVRPSDPPLDHPSNEHFSMLQHAAKALTDCIDKKRVGEKVTSTYVEIEEMINAVHDAAKGLPNLETLRTALEEPMEKLNLQGYVADDKNATLYAFNKEFLRGQLVSDRVGTNDKTKVICKLTLKEAGPPPREAIVSEAERNAMAAFYFKRQEELKRLADADEDDYLNSEWADPKGMKRNLQGLKDVKAPGLPL